ncbi:MAG TPA: class I SAM-dependent methyltransferase [Rhodocyclaceae bacterium]|nr:class I SAM-dependent methyltransferase [Rhodocyclaceae bacterium]
MRSAAAQIHWEEAGVARSAPWRSAAAVPPPKRVFVADDRLPADAAYKLICEGTALLWRGDYHNARQLLQAIARRVARKPRKLGATAAESFHLHRQSQGHRARILGMLLIPVEADGRIPLRRAPDVAEACIEACGQPEAPFIVSLREVQAWVGAHEWRKKGVPVAALGANIHPWYGVFSPVRGEYVGLVAQAPLPATDLAFDIGTGTGVLAAVLAKRGVARVIATDQDERALACARENLERLGFAARIELEAVDLFPAGRASLIVCNPPWVPAKPTSPIEYAIYDPESAMLRGFLAGVSAHLAPGGEAWLILSDIGEHLGLRTRADLEGWIAAGGLRVIARHDTRPHHPKASDDSDPLSEARRQEMTSLWRLAAR